MSRTAIDLSPVSGTSPLGMDDPPLLQSPLICHIPKRQRRLTLTAMTGALGEIPSTTSAEPPAAGADADLAMGRASSASSIATAASADAGLAARLAKVPRPPRSLRDSSPSPSASTACPPSTGTLRASPLPPRPHPAAKRLRDSIGSDAGPEVMLERAAQRLAQTVQKGAADDRSASSGDTDEEDAATLLRRQRAFECGIMVAEGRAGISDGWATTVGVGVALSPRSFARGAKAAEVAAKAAEELRQRRLEEKRAEEEQLTKEEAARRSGGKRALGARSACGKSPKEGGA